MSSDKKKKRDIPRFNSPIIETHCHLDYLKSFEISEIIEKSKEVGIEKIVTIAVEPGNLDRVIEIAKDNENVYCTQGIHPHDARLWTDEVDKKIYSQATFEKNVAIGEIGLDYHYDNSPREKQREVFDRQLAMASELDLPVVIHSRDAEEDTKAILKNHLNGLNKKGVIHSFTSSIDLAEFAIENDFYLGFNGIITFKSADNVREAVKITPLNRLLLETDAPFLTPIPFRGRENAPFYLPFVAEKLAELKEVSVDELLPQVYSNSFSLFSFS